MWDDGLMGFGRYRSGVRVEYEVLVEGRCYRRRERRAAVDL